MGLLEIAGGALGIFGLIVVTIADWQKQTFKKSPENAGKWCDIGLFKYSRHPNYCGDLCVVWGILDLNAYSHMAEMGCCDQSTDGECDHFTHIRSSIV